MNRFLSRVQPVRREKAAEYVLYSLLSFAASIILTRVFLELTGYPQVGNQELHIAHVLWGGLLLFFASLLPLIYSNQWVYPASALLSGAGVGLFIDEVGKFITQTNDYFHPFAAPIIYSLFLFTVLVYLSVRRPAPRSPRAELYRALDDIRDVLDQDLDDRERAILVERLRYVISAADDPDLRAFAEALLQFIASPSLQVLPHRPLFGSEFADWLRRVETRFLTRGALRVLLSAACCLIGSAALIDLIFTVSAIITPSSLEELAARLLSTQPQVRGAVSLTWALIRPVLEGAIGTFLFCGGILLAIGRDELGTRLAYFGLLIALTMINLLVFYFDQFATLLGTSLQFVLLLGVIRYRARFLSPQSDDAGIVPNVSG